MAVFNVAEALSDPASLDRPAALGEGCEISAAAFASRDRLVLCSDTDAEDFWDDEERAGQPFRPGTVATFDPVAGRILSAAPVEQTVGTMMPVGTSHVIGFHTHPKLIDISTGRVTRSWPELDTGRQTSSIIHHIDPPPPIALDPARRRFAVAGEDRITVVQLGPDVAD